MAKTGVGLARQGANAAAGAVSPILTSTPGAAYAAAPVATGGALAAAGVGGWTAGRAIANATNSDEVLAKKVWAPAAHATGVFKKGPESAITAVPMGPGANVAQTTDLWRKWLGQGNSPTNVQGWSKHLEANRPAQVQPSSNPKGGRMNDYAKRGYLNWLGGTAALSNKNPHKYSSNYNFDLSKTSSLLTPLIKKANAFARLSSNFIKKPQITGMKSFIGRPTGPDGRYKLPVKPPVKPSIQSPKLRGMASVAPVAVAGAAGYGLNNLTPYLQKLNPFAAKKEPTSAYDRTYSQLEEILKASKNDPSLLPWVTARYQGPTVYPEDVQSVARITLDNADLGRSIRDLSMANRFYMTNPNQIRNW